MTAITQVVLTVVLDDGSRHELVRHRPQPTGGNPAFLARQVATGVRELYVEAAGILTAVHGDQYPPDDQPVSSSHSDVEVLYTIPAGVDTCTYVIRDSDRPVSVTDLHVVRPDGSPSVLPRHTIEVSDDTVTVTFSSLTFRDLNLVRTR
ncbi:hypothetical protein [Phycicoccus sp.]|uniref:hypothetical protein n=1 Tax=Phycicoccus sp. TaxID=1902410 RepID=UPI002D00FE15|nr:hypothetical protein [Phycicoccus sp.]HMM95293.1 hypothetical protein [Phycicoccus sp.]